DTHGGPDTGGNNPDTHGGPDTGGNNPDTHGGPDTGGNNPDTHGGGNPDTSGNGGEGVDLQQICQPGQIFATSGGVGYCVAKPNQMPTQPVPSQQQAKKQTKKQTKQQTKKQTKQQTKQQTSNDWKQDFVFVIEQLSQTCLNKLQVQLPAPKTSGETAEQIAEALLSAGVGLVAKAPECIAGIAAQFTNGILPPDATDRLAKQLGIQLPHF
ncbi:hypothetical protein ACIGXH_48405, partial [Streptomyces sp. NPDC055105]